MLVKFYLGQNEDCSLGDSVSNSSEANGELGYIVFNKRQVVGNMKIIKILVKENKVPKVKEFSTFQVWEDARVWAYWNHSFDMHLSYLGPVFCIFHILSFFSDHHREWL